MQQDQSDNFDAYMDLGVKDVARLVLCLLIESKLRKRLAAFRPEDTSPQPVEGLKEFGVARHDVVLEGHALR